MSSQTPERILQRLDWQVIRRLDGLLQGDYRSLFIGFGLDLAELREYQPGDDVRAIDWNVTARLTVPYVRQFLEDREITAWFLLDLTPSINFGSNQQRKQDVLLDFVATVARLITRHGNRVGAIVENGAQRKVLPARGGRNQVLWLVHDLLEQPALARTPPTDLSLLFASAANAIQRRALIFILSDFISAPGWEIPLGHLCQRHEVLAVRLHDPSELDMPDLGLVWIEDAESGEQILVDTSDPLFRQRFHQAAQQREAQLRATMQRLAIDSLFLSTEDDLVQALVRFSAARRLKRQNPTARVHSFQNRSSRKPL